MERPSKEVLTVVAVTLLELARGHSSVSVGTRVTITGLTTLVILLGGWSKPRGEFIRACGKAIGAGGVVYLSLFIQQTHQWPKLFV